MEQWKPIPKYEGIYDASNCGRIRSAVGKTTSNNRYPMRRWKSRIIKPRYSINRKGRRDARVCLWKDGEERYFLVARLVASAWLGEPKDGMTVNHINGDYNDNRPENLEWVSLADNIKHGFENGLFDSFQRRVSLTDNDGNATEYRSFSQASAALGRNSGYISTALSRGQTVATSRNGTHYSIKPL